jgi:hypothetical protein
MGVPVTVPRGHARRRDSSRFHTPGVATDPNKGTVVGVGDFDLRGGVEFRCHATSWNKVFFACTASSPAQDLRYRYDLGPGRASILRSDDVVFSVVAQCLHRPASGGDGDCNEVDGTTGHGCRHLYFPFAWVFGFVLTCQRRLGLVGGSVVDAQAMDPQSPWLAPTRLRTADAQDRQLPDGAVI